MTTYNYNMRNTQNNNNPIDASIKNYVWFLSLVSVSVRVKKNYPGYLPTTGSSLYLYTV